MPRINITQLPQLVQDMIELREATDPTFFRFTDYDKTDAFWDLLNQKRHAGAEKSIILSVTGMQGCHLRGTMIQTSAGLKPIESVVFGDLVWAGGAWRVCVPVIRGRQQTLKIVLRNGVVLNLTPDHKMRVAEGWRFAEDLKVGDALVAGSIPWSTVWNDDSEKAMVVGMLLADGHMDRWMVKEKYDYVRVSKRKQKKVPKEYHEYEKKRVRLYNKDAEVHRRFVSALREYYSATAFGSYEDVFEGVRRSTVTCIQNQVVCDALEAAGVPYGAKAGIVEVPSWVQMSDEAMNGFLAGYFVCDGSFYGGGIEICSKSERILRQMQCWLLARGVVSVIKGKSGKDIWRLFVRQWDSVKEWVDHVPSLSEKKKVVLRSREIVPWLKYDKKIVERWWGMKRSGMTYQQIADLEGVCYSPVWQAMNRGDRGISFFRKNATREYLLEVMSVELGEFGDVYDLHVEGVHEYVANGLVSHNSGKSWASLAMCCYLDSGFRVENIFFGYNDLVYNKHTLTDDSAVLVDEQSQTYGLDAHRVMVILANLKEQLRKRGIHFIFCSPVLYEEARSSMYLLETIFIDEEEQECICAWKTRDGQTIGHVRIPSPLKPIDERGGLASKELMEAYEQKKDEHLEIVLGRKDYDVFEDRARMLMKNPMFIKAEKVYVTRYGYIPNNSLIQLINKLYPEFNAGVVSGEIAGRVRLDKELSGKWDIAGRSGMRRKNGA